jgi:hypothetical protein
MILPKIPVKINSTKKMAVNICECCCAMGYLDKIAHGRSNRLCPGAPAPDPSRPVAGFWCRGGVLRRPMTGFWQHPSK